MATGRRRVESKGGYEEGYEAGYEDGYSAGYSQGLEDVYSAVPSIKDDIFLEMFTHYHRRSNILVYTKDVEELYNSLSYIEVPATSSWGLDYSSNTIDINPLAAGDTVRLGWDLPKFTQSVYILLATTCARYTRIKLINTDTGDYYMIESYPPATAADNRVYKYVNGTLSANINIVGGLDMPNSMVVLLSWDSRTYVGAPAGTTPTFPDTLIGIRFVSTDPYGASINFVTPWVMRDTSITEINRIEIEFYNDGTAAYLAQVGHGMSNLYFPFIIAYD